MTERTSKMGKRNRFATKFPKLSFKNTFCFVVKNTKLLKRNIDGGKGGETRQYQKAGDRGVIEQSRHKPLYQFVLSLCTRLEASPLVIAATFLYITLSVQP